MKAVLRVPPVLLVLLFLPLCTLVVQPFVASGINDDFSYLQTAYALFKTGHVQYNGWAAPILGWQLYLSDLLFHLFGFSFTAARMGTMLVAAAGSAVAFRICRLGGLQERFALLASFTLITSPLYLQLAFSYMTDIYGMFALTFCLMCCMEAVRAETENAALAWICAAMVSNAVTGTARQVAWVGVLVLCPAALWLMRRRLRVVFLSVPVLLVSWAFIVWCMRWQHAQPFVPAEPSLVPHLGKDEIATLVQQSLQVFLEICVFCAPVFFLFVFALKRRQQMLLAAFAVLFGGAVYLVHVHSQSPWMLTRVDPLLLFPYMPNYITRYGGVDGTYLHGTRPELWHPAGRAIVSAFGMACVFAFVWVYRTSGRNKETQATPRTRQLSRFEVNVLCLSLLASYALMHVPRITGNLLMYDRYLPPVLLIVLFFVLRAWQERMRRRSLVPAWILVAIVGMYGLAVTHDTFAFHRARVAAIGELLDAKVNPVTIDGGLEFNMITQIEHTGFVYGPHLPQSRAVHFDFPAEGPATCIAQFRRMQPSVHPRYNLSFDPTMCGGRAPFAPVFYHPWLGQHTVPLYILNVTPAGPNEP